MKAHQARIEKLHRKAAASRSSTQLATIQSKDELFTNLSSGLDRESVRQLKSPNEGNARGHDLRLTGTRKPDSAFETDWQAKPTILLVASRAFFRDCFARCLKIAYNDHVVFSFASVGRWLRSGEAAASSPSFAILVIESADASSFAQLELLEDAPEKLPVIVVSDVEDAGQIVQTLKRGARGYIPTNLPFSVAVEAVRLVAAGGVFVPANSFVHPDQPSASVNSGVAVTKREKEVIEEIRRGRANKQIAYELNMSEHTVKLHLRHIMRKLRARNRTQVAMFDGDFVTTKS